jgi:hypothetical protein
MTDPTKAKTLVLIDKYIEDLSAGSALDNSSVRVAVMHLRDVRNKVDNEV